MDRKKLAEGVHEGLLELFRAEAPGLAEASDDTRSLAVRLVDMVVAEGSGKALPGAFDAELDHRARLLVAVSGALPKGSGQRVARLIACYRQALVAAVDAVMEAAEEEKAP